MLKKSQTTIFVIICVVFISIFVFMIYINNDKSYDNKNINDPIFTNSKNYVESCVEKVGVDAVKFVSFNGGYYFVDINNEYINLDLLKIPVYYDKNYIKNIPSKDILIENIESYYKTHLQKCLSDINNSVDITINSDLDISIFLDDSEIKVSLDSPLVIKYLDKKITYNNFSSVIKINLGKIHNKIIDFINLQDKYKGFILNSYIIDISKDDNFQVEMIEKDNYIIYSFIDKESGNNIVYNFAIEYGGDE